MQGFAANIRTVKISSGASSGAFAKVSRYTVTSIALERGCRQLSDTLALYRITILVLARVKNCNGLRAEMFLITLAAI